MSIHRKRVIDQTSQYMEYLSSKNNTAKSTCGYITMAICQFLSEQTQFNIQIFNQINEVMLTPYIQKSMKKINQSRKLQIQKFQSTMSTSQKKNYLTDWVANYQIANYLEHISDKMLNPQVYFYRQSAYDHPKAMENVKFQEKERIKEQQPFKGGLYFYTSFNKLSHHYKEQFKGEISHFNYELPAIIATDILGHFNTTILFKGEIYILDSLGSSEDYYEGGIVQYIKTMYKCSFLKQ